MMSNVSLIDGHDDAVLKGDLISRSALQKAFGDPPFIRDATEAEIQKYRGWLRYAGIVANAPAVDAVHVVRCRDCVWFNTNGYEEGNEDKEDDFRFGFCRVWNRETQACVFCSYGKRRDG